MGDGPERITQVKIFNQTYGVKSDDDPEYVRQLAQFVDERMQEVFRLTPTVDSLKVAVLAALNIADDYVALREKLNHLEREVAERGSRMNAQLNAFLDPGPS